MDSNQEKDLISMDKNKIINNEDNNVNCCLSSEIDKNTNIKNSTNSNRNSQFRIKMNKKPLLNGFSGYVNDDIIEEQESTYTDRNGCNSGNSSGCASGSGNGVRTKFNRLAIRRQPPIPKETINGTNLHCRSKSNFKIRDNSLILELNNIVNKGDPKKKFKVLDKIDRGATCAVYSAINLISNEKVAIKVMQIERSYKKELLKLELSILNNRKHPNVINYYDSYLVDNKEIWIIMEYLEVGPLNRFIAKFELTERKIAVISKEILKGLDYLHKNQIIHRDLKSNNILLGRNGEIKIIDFGFSAELNNLSEKKFTPIGNGFFRSPEISKREAYDNKIDIWSFGIILYEMICGEPPNFDKTASYAAEMILKHGKPKIDYDDISKDLGDFYDKCLELDPSKRASARELLKHKFLESTESTKSLLTLIDYSLNN